jgi:excisionase family DNA binding protein
MAQTYTLDEAAQRLGVPLDEFKRRIKDDWKTLRSFRDGATLRFRSSDIDELARSLGEASDPGLQLGSPGKAPMQPGSSEEFLLAPEDMTPTDENDDIFSVAAGDSGKTKKQKSASDSDVRLEPDPGPKSPRVKKPGKSSDRLKNLGNMTDEIDLDMLAGPKSGVLRPGADSSSKLKAPKSGPNLAGPGAANKIPGPPPTDDIMGGDSSSEFELSLDTDSDSFELQLNTEQSDEIDLGSGPKGRAGQSGINLGKPKDSGVSLEKKGKDAAKPKKPAPPVADDSDDFELSLDSDSSELETSSPLESSPLAEKTGRDDSDSEFELSLDDNSGVTDNIIDEAEAQAANKGDIFETDFSMPPVSEADSASEVVEVESSDTDLENSDFDLALDESDIQQGDDESASQVVLLDDDSGPQESAGKAGARALAGAGAAAKRKKKAAVEDDDEEDASEALAGVRRKTDDDDDAVPAGGYAPPAKWPGWIIAPLALTFLFTFLGGVMSYELLKGMWGYHDGRTTTGGLANMVAGGLGMETEKAK